MHSFFQGIDPYIHIHPEAAKEAEKLLVRSTESVWLKGERQSENGWWMHGGYLQVVGDAKILGEDPRLDGALNSRRPTPRAHRQTQGALVVPTQVLILVELISLADDHILFCSDNRNE